MGLIQPVLCPEKADSLWLREYGSSTAPTKAKLFRGDTVDVFPAEHSELALRIELFDDEVEAMSLFDPLTGQIRQKLARFTVYPSSHYVTPREQVLMLSFQLIGP